MCHWFPTPVKKGRRSVYLRESRPKLAGGSERRGRWGLTQSTPHGCSHSSAAAPLAFARLCPRPHTLLGAAGMLGMCDETVRVVGHKPERTKTACGRDLNSREAEGGGGGTTPRASRVKKKGEKTLRALLQPPSPPYAQVLATMLLFCTTFHRIGTSGDPHPSQEAEWWRWG